MLEGHDGVDPLFDERRTGDLRHNDALIDGAFDVDEARQDLLESRCLKKMEREYIRETKGFEQIRKDNNWKGRMKNGEKLIKRDVGASSA